MLQKLLGLTKEFSFIKDWINQLFSHVDLKIEMNIKKVDELQARLKDLENFVYSLDEDFIEHKKSAKINLINIAQKSKLKPKDLVTFDKKYFDFYNKVEEEAEKALTKMPE